MLKKALWESSSPEQTLIPGRDVDLTVKLTRKGNTVGSMVTSGIGTRRFSLELTEQNREGDSKSLEVRKYRRTRERVNTRARFHFNLSGSETDKNEQKRA